MAARAEFRSKNHRRVCRKKAQEAQNGVEQKLAKIAKENHPLRTAAMTADEREGKWPHEPNSASGSPGRLFRREMVFPSLAQGPELVEGLDPAFFPCNPWLFWLGS